MEAGSCSHEAASRGVFHLLMYATLNRTIPELGPIMYIVHQVVDYLIFQIIYCHHNIVISFQPHKYRVKKTIAIPSNFLNHYSFFFQICFQVPPLI